MINADALEPSIVKAIEDSWCEETGGLFCPDNPSKYQCAVTALVVQDYYGGKLVRGHVIVDERHISHYWNELPDGTTVDLTRQQFAEPLELVNDGYRERDYVLNAMGSTTKERYEVLKLRVDRLI